MTVGINNVLACARALKRLSNAATRHHQLNAAKARSLNVRAFDFDFMSESSTYELSIKLIQAISI